MCGKKKNRIEYCNIVYMPWRRKNYMIIYYVHALLQERHLSRLNTSRWRFRRRGEGYGRGKSASGAMVGLMWGGGYGVYLIFGTRRFVECHLNSELIIRQAEHYRPSGARPAAATARHHHGGPAIYYMCAGSGPPPATTIVRCVLQCAQLNFSNLFPSTPRNSVN